MARQIRNITPQMLRNAYVEYLQKIHKQSPEAFADFTEKELADFIRLHDNPHFSGIYQNLNHNYYDQVRNRIATNPQMRAEDDTRGQAFSVHIRTYSSFLESKIFKQLAKQKVNVEGSAYGKNSTPTDTSPTKTSQPKPKERELTEGEKKHVEFEQAHRNPALRQACIDKYGYQCQCCGMNFADLYGETLGSRFIEVHHLKMLSSYDESRPDDYVENLVPLCSNCHSMIHHGENGPLTLRELRAAYKGEKKEIKVWKED